ncbi:replication protein P [Congregibacter variabilis]|uniref:Replication protein P n=1 Tax=Congregibacter variabilis TaxID=3081200 RepID=A0ABZ0I3G1_9GAMM|nr:replication protein P [Congregibacter sp. IMCC43200]
MQDSGELAQRVEREIAASRATSPIPPGQSDSRGKPDPALVEAINQVFALFRLNYHNQYYAAFSDAEQLRQIKKLWLDSLKDVPPAQILQGAKLAIENSEYLPTLNRMHKCCEESLPALGLPAARAAYLEACNAGSPPELKHWSHPAVYWAGRDCGWQQLATAPEPQSWPLFNRHYQSRCATLLMGDEIPPIPEPPKNRLISKALEGDAALEQIQRLKADNDL